MPYQSPGPGYVDDRCTVCGRFAQIDSKESQDVVDCLSCGDFILDHVLKREFGLPLLDDKDKAVASYLIRKLQKSGRAVLTREFFASLREHSLPTPSELCDNLLLLFAEKANGQAGARIKLSLNRGMDAIVGCLHWEDLDWAANALGKNGMIVEEDASSREFTISFAGWNRLQELQGASTSSRYAFLARRFTNPDLDELYEKCLLPAVKQTGYDLRTATQKAGHIDAIVEDEIRRCRFLIADLSDDNAGAYWEAGFAEGIGKPVIYICRDDLKTHFDTDHRQTVRWHPARLGETAARLKAVVRNTLLGDAVQDD